ncbi:MAG: RNA polymerase sigma factor [Eudoraea sp.]|nr:RNA polymerase sigma factor [Eudoraea sp.]
MEKINRIFDGLLVLQYKGGDRKAMATLIKRYHNQLCSHAFWYTRDMDLAKDVVQDSWHKALGSIGKLKDPNKFSSWIMTIVTRKSLDRLDEIRKERVQKEHIRHTLKPRRQEPESRYNPELLQRLKSGIQNLSIDHQTVVRLFYLQEYSMKEISEILGISAGTVKSRLFYAREKLKTYLK